MNQPSGENAAARDRGIGVADEAIGTATPDLARFARLDVVAVVVDEAHLDARAAARRRCSTRFSRGDSAEQPVIDGCSVLTEAARRRDAEPLGTLADRGRNRGTAEPDDRHERDVPHGIEVGMIEQAREEDRRALARPSTPSSSIACEHTRPGSHTSMR